MKTILLTNKYSGKPIQIVQDEVPDGFQINFLTEQTQETLKNEVSDADYILAGGRLKITKDILREAKNLKMIQRSGVGLDTLDLDAIREKRIPLYVNQGINSESAAEHTLLLILACLRRLPLIDKNTKKGIWKKQEQGVQTSELKGKTVGIIGMGNIAKALLRLLKPFDVKILYYSRRRMTSSLEKEYKMSFTELDRLLHASDIVTIHCSLNEETRNLINTESVSAMKDGAILINTARGEIVDPYAVAEGLRKEKLSYAALDVHFEEPIPVGYPLKELENVILTPHIAGITEDSFRAMMHDAFRNIECFDRGELLDIEPYRYL